jgi:transglutaminase-like putative cysteine protease
MNSRALDAVRQCLPHVVTVIALAVLWTSYTIAAALGLGLVVAVSRFRKSKPTFLGHFIIMLGGAAAAYALARTLEGRIQVELASLFLGGAIARLTIEKPLMSRALDIALLAFALVAMGVSREIPKNVYLATSLVFALTGLFFLSEAPHARILRARAPSAILGLVVAGLVAAALGGATRRLSGASGAGAFFAHGWGKTGFTGRVHLDDGELVPSNDIVMRIRGGKVDYLRGSVLDWFDGEDWSHRREEKAQRFVDNERGSIEVEANAPSRYLFAPHGGVGVTDGAQLDVYGVTFVQVGISTYTIDPHGGVADPAPGPLDTEVPIRIQRQIFKERLVTLARTIVGDETDHDKQLVLLEKYLLANYRYSLSRHGKSNEKLVIFDFLFGSKEGRCEFFSTSLVLLARSLGIPARVVTGYRVVDQNTYGHYWVVREKHAHAWVEAWSDEKKAFVTHDPTPVMPAMFDIDDDGPLALADAARTKLGDLTAALGQNRGWLLFALAMLVAAFVGRGVLVSFLAKRRAKAADTARPYFLELSTMLANAGLARDPAEGVETYAERVEGAGEAEAAALLRRYALHRYGGEEDDATLARAFATLAKTKAKATANTGTKGPRTAA